MELRSSYGKNVKPALAQLLQTLRLDVNYIRAQGDMMYYRDDKGKEVGVLDLAGGMGATILGHNHPAVCAVRRKFIDDGRVVHDQASAREDAGELAAALAELYPGKERRYTIFTNSGAETVEAALKHAELNRMKRIQALWKDIYRNHNEIKEHCRRHFDVKLPKDYKEKGIDILLGEIMMQGHLLQQLPPVVISTEKSFHGKTTSAVRVTGNPMYREAFARLSGIDARFVEFNNPTDLEKAIQKSYVTLKKLQVIDGRIKFVDVEFLNVAAFIMEPVQGEGGVHVATREYMTAIEKLKKKYDFEWIVDEIQTGMGRTGKLFAIEHYPIDPDSVDYVCLSKALGGGVVKNGALMIREAVHEPYFGILHTSTFAEDTESSLVGKKALELLTDKNENLLGRVREQGEYFMKRLDELKKKYPDVVKEVRGKGLLIALELVSQEKKVTLFFRRVSAQGMLGAFLAGYLLREHNIRTIPPLNSMVSRKPVNVIRIEPSAYISQADIERVIAALDCAFEIIRKANAYAFSKFIIGRETPGGDHEVNDYSNIAESAEQRAYKQDNKRMAFLIHPLDIRQVCEKFDPSLGELNAEKDPVTGKSDRELYWDLLVMHLDSFVFREVVVRSPRTGDTVEAKFIAFPFTTRQMVEMRREAPQLLVDGVQKAVDLGATLGADICGLGAFTSIVTKNGTELDNTWIRITSGNSYTTALVWQSVLKAAEYLQLDLAHCTAAIVGAGGNIGSVTASLLAEDFPKLILIGRMGKGSLSRLKETAVTIYSDTVDQIRTTRPMELKGLAREIAADILMPFAALNTREYRFDEDKINAFIDKNFSGKERRIGHLLKSLWFVRLDPDIGPKLAEAVKLKHGSDPYIIMTTNARRYLPAAEVVVSAVSADAAFLNPDWFKPGAIVNDVSLPPSISVDLYKKRPDVVAIQGGIGHLPEYINLGIPGLSIGATLGCMAETFILTMMDMLDNYSYGKITKQQVVKIWETGRILGFGLAAIKYQDKKLTRDIAEEIKRKSTAATK